MPGEIVPLVPSELTENVIRRETMLSPVDGASQDPPQWAILGIQLYGRCAVMASSTLTRAEMRRQIVDYEQKRATGRPLRLRKDTAAVGFVCDGFTLIYGETYASALASLAETWQPPEIEQ
jgi:hypothetical protein